jgi:hypothetical protein
MTDMQPDLIGLDLRICISLLRIWHATLNGGHFVDLIPQKPESRPTFAALCEELATLDAQGSFQLSTVGMVVVHPLLMLDQSNQYYAGGAGSQLDGSHDLTPRIQVTHSGSAGGYVTGEDGIGRKASQSASACVYEYSDNQPPPSFTGIASTSVPQAPTLCSRASDGRASLRSQGQCSLGRARTHTLTGGSDLWDDYRTRNSLYSAECALEALGGGYSRAVESESPKHGLTACAGLDGRRDVLTAGVALMAPSALPLSAKGGIGAYDYDSRARDEGRGGVDISTQGMPSSMPQLLLSSTAPPNHRSAADPPPITLDVVGCAASTSTLPNPPLASHDRLSHPSVQGSDLSEHSAGTSVQDKLRTASPGPSKACPPASGAPAPSKAEALAAKLNNERNARVKLVGLITGAKKSRQQGNAPQHPDSMQTQASTSAQRLRSGSSSDAQPQQQTSSQMAGKGTASAWRPSLLAKRFSSTSEHSALGSSIGSALAGFLTIPPSVTPTLSHNSRTPEPGVGVQTYVIIEDPTESET